MRLGILAFGIVSYAAFAIVFACFAGFLTGIAGPWSMNAGPKATPLEAAAVNVGLLLAFGLSHSLLARDRIKALVRRVVPEMAERSVYVLQSSAFLALAMWQWRPMPEALWSLDGLAALGVHGIFLIGMALVLASTFAIDHFELFGLRQSWAGATQRIFEEPEFRTPLLYRIVRHPMQLGMVIALFATPVMTVGHLLFAVGMTLYVFVGLHFEERALQRRFGDVYRDYQRRVPMLVPRLLGGRVRDAEA